jgi:short-subunit dehydrogenase
VATSIFKPVTVITGASVGIGAALARVFANNGHEVALVARREKEMILLANELSVSAAIKPHVIVADLFRSDAPARIAHDLFARGLEPAIIVNNAGYGLHGPAAEIDRAEQLAMIDLNIRAVTDLSLRWIDGIVKH